MSLFNVGNIKDCYLGAAPFKEVYQGSNLVYQRISTFDLVGGEDISLESWLENQGAVAGRDVVITQSGTTGGVLQQAIITGDLSLYNSVTLDVTGEAQGKTGGDAIHITSANFTLNNNGAIRAGGGIGGAGGKGGDGDNIGSDWSGFIGGWVHPAPEYYWRCPVNGTLDWFIVFFNGIKEVDQRSWNRTNVYLAGGSGWSYYRAASGVTNQNDGAGDNDWYAVGRSHHKYGTGGAGGAGGIGRGYLQARTDGDGGTGSNYRAGTGGAGGNGGDWGADGTNGYQGGTGYKYSISKTTNSVFGAAGTGKGLAGKAITSTVAYTFNDNGVVNGVVG